MVQPTLLFENILTKRYCLLHIVFQETFDLKTIWFNPRWVSRKFSLKGNKVQHTLSFQNILTRRQYRSIRIVFEESFDQKTTWFKQYCLFEQFSSKDNIIQLYGCQESFEQKTKWFNSYCLLRKFDEKIQRFDPEGLFRNISSK